MVVAKREGAASTSKAVVSVGVVDEQMEKILYARVKVPDDCEIEDDTFVRRQGGLKPDWRKGIELSAAQGLIHHFSRSLRGVVVGWELQSDLSALGFTEASALAKDEENFPPYGRRTRLPQLCDICELTDYYRTAINRNKCQLSEAYNFVFGRQLSAHDAGDDAQMTMELYKHWCDLGNPLHIPIPLKFYNVTVHRFDNAGHRAQCLWTFLRPVDSAGRLFKGMKERDDGTTFKLRFRQKEHQIDYVRFVAERIQGSSDPSAQVSQPQSLSIGGLEIDCGAFKMHLTEVDR